VYLNTTKVIDICGHPSDGMSIEYTLGMQCSCGIPISPIQMTAVEAQTWAERFGQRGLGRESWVKRVELRGLGRESWVKRVELRGLDGEGWAERTGQRIWVKRVGQRRFGREGWTERWGGREIGYAGWVLMNRCISCPCFMQFMQWAWPGLTWSKQNGRIHRHGVTNTVNVSCTH